MGILCVNESAVPDTVDTSLSIPVIIIELLPSKNASSPIDTSSLSVVSLPSTFPVAVDSLQGLLSAENARVSEI